MCRVGEGFPKCILRSLIPVPIRSARDDIESSLVSAMRKERSNDAISSWSSAVLTERDRGLHDNIVPTIARFNKDSGIRKKIAESVRF